MYIHIWMYLLFLVLALLGLAWLGWAWNNILNNLSVFKAIYLLLKQALNYKCSFPHSGFITWKTIYWMQTCIISRILHLSIAHVPSSDSIGCIFLENCCLKTNPIFFLCKKSVLSLKLDFFNFFFLKFVYPFNWNEVDSSYFGSVCFFFMWKKTNILKKSHFLLFSQK